MVQQQTVSPKKMAKLRKMIKQYKGVENIPPEVEKEFDELLRECHIDKETLKNNKSLSKDEQSRMLASEITGQEVTDDMVLGVGDITENDEEIFKALDDSLTASVKEDAQYILKNCSGIAKASGQHFKFEVWAEKSKAQPIKYKVKSGKIVITVNSRIEETLTAWESEDKEQLMEYINAVLAFVNKHGKKISVKEFEL